MNTRALLGCGVVAGPVFVASFLLQGAVLAGYDPLRHPVSSLALGPYGWVQSASFIGCGLLVVALAVALTGLWGRLLLGVWGLSLVGAGVFITDPVGGYPPGTPPLSDYTTSGLLHDLFAIPTLVALPIACLVLARRFGRAWTVYSLVTAAVFPALWILAGLGFQQDPSLVEVAGLFQRAAITTAWAWITALAVTLRQSGPRPARTGTFADLRPPSS
ncbi:DUF998 domain-containing protein [Nonomuraea endophytica]|uniref:Putative membrane protein n=1 Tax=Nonomuraea endophytica TaxID=714136 RepID=A0A7W8A4C8_9ACTN|nr:DUF998 domain-containing protein [Nonomuraea endophytica]MBB5079289.1 putative membrane protein [Nonomuraea endophytica]